MGKSNKSDKPDFEKLEGVVRACYPLFSGKLVHVAPAEMNIKAITQTAQTLFEHDSNLFYAAAAIGISYAADFLHLKNEARTMALQLAQNLAQKSTYLKNNQ